MKTKLTIETPSSPILMTMQPTYHFPGHARFVDRAADELGIASGSLRQRLWTTLSRVSELSAQASGRTPQEIAAIVAEARSLRAELSVQIRAIDLILEDISAHLPDTPKPSPHSSAPSGEVQASATTCQTTAPEHSKARSDRKPRTKAQSN